MAENIPNPPGGAVPPPRKETGKVQPKKETVRINLPPKPSAAPTIKLPTLPPGGPTGAPSASPTAPAAPAPASVPRATAAPVAQKPAAPAAQRPAPRAAAAKPTVGVFDTVLAVAALIVCLAAVGSTVWMMMILNEALGQ
jgi:translation initiation factor IF-2